MKYIFRGNVVLDYDEKEKQFKQTEYGLDFCQLIPEDFALLEHYFKVVNMNRNFGKALEADIEVN